MPVPPVILRPAHDDFVVRELRLSDAPACEAFSRGLDRQDVRMRFASLHFSLNYLLPGLAGPTQDTAFAAVDAAAAILGIVNLGRLNADTAELAVVVRSDRKRRGIGWALVARGLEWAEASGVSAVFGLVLADNHPMLALARAMGFQSSRSDGVFVEVRQRVARWSRRRAEHASRCCAGTG